MSIQPGQFRILVQDLGLKALSKNLKTQLATDAVAQIFCEGILKGEEAVTIAQTIFSTLPLADQTESSRLALQNWVQRAISAQAQATGDAPSTTAKMPADCEVSEDGCTFIKLAEGFRSKPYDDHTAQEVTSFAQASGFPTVGYGHKITSAAEFEKYKNGIDESQAAALLKQDLEDTKRKIVSKVKVPLEQRQFDALMSLVLNVGSDKTPKLFEKLNAKDILGAAHEFSDVTKSKGKELAGLVNRRADEIELFLMGDVKRDYQ